MSSDRKSQDQLEHQKSRLENGGRAEHTPEDLSTRNVPTALPRSASDQTHSTSSPLALHLCLKNFKFREETGTLGKIIKKLIRALGDWQLRVNMKYDISHQVTCHS